MAHQGAAVLGGGRAEHEQIGVAVFAFVVGGIELRHTQSGQHLVGVPAAGGDPRTNDRDRTPVLDEVPAQFGQDGGRGLGIAPGDLDLLPKNAAGAVDLRHRCLDADAHLVRDRGGATGKRHQSADPKPARLRDRRKAGDGRRA